MQSMPALDAPPEAECGVGIGVAGSADPQARLEATERLVTEYHADVFRYARWLTGCNAAAEDISQEVFLQAFRGIHNLRDPSSGRSWLLTITRHEFTRWSKKAAHAKGGFLLEETGTLESGERQFEEVEWVERGLRELPEEYRYVLLLYYFEQLSYAEIAEELGIPMGTVMSRLSRGKSQLKEALLRLAN